MGCLYKSKKVFVCVILFSSVLWLSQANVLGAERVIGSWSPGGFDAGGLEPYSNVQSMLKARAAAAEVLDKLYARPGVK